MNEFQRAVLQRARQQFADCEATLVNAILGKLPDDVLRRHAASLIVTAVHLGQVERRMGVERPQSTEAAI